LGRKKNSAKMAGDNYDLVCKMTQYLDPHLILMLLHWLEAQKLHDGPSLTSASAHI